jgi:protein-L-isoaspartate(D-aspartate) O-methyltransferase
MDVYSQARKNMLDCQLSTNGINDNHVLSSFNQIPRELFLPDKLKPLAYIDEDLPFENGGFLMEPLIFARMVQCAEIESDDIILNLGDYCGFSSAVLSSMATTVVVLESRVGVLDRARKVWADMDLCNIAVLKGKPENGCPEHGPYSLIFINGAIETIPDSLLSQLTTGGRLVCVKKKAQDVAGQITLLKKLSDNDYSTVKLNDASTPFIEEFRPEGGFEF